MRLGFARSYKRNRDFRLRKHIRRCVQVSLAVLSIFFFFFFFKQTPGFIVLFHLYARHYLINGCQPLRYERHIVLPKLLAQHVEDYEIENTMYNQDPHKGGTARRYLCSILKEHVNCYSIEVSMYGYNRKAMPGIFPYTEEGCIL